MDLYLLNPKVQEFIAKNCGETISKLALQKNPFPDVDWTSILNQIEAKSKAKNKLPTWFSTKNIIYPSKISVEQTSSEITAAYKSELVSGESLIDLTGGFGVDDFYFAKKVKNIFHCELNESLSEIVEHNFKQLNASNIKCFVGDSLDLIKELNANFDWIFIDPSRRNNAKGKVFLLKDCLPNVPENLDFLFQFSKYILIKTAPLLDISAGLSELKNVKTIHIIAVENEVKELLWEINKDYRDSILIKTINFYRNDKQFFEFILGENTGEIQYDLPRKYLYEPNTGIMKSGGFDQVGVFYHLHKFHKHSHLYTNDEIIEFPGRIFEIQNCISYQKSAIKLFLENKQANITTRNFPESVENIRKKWKIKDGGNQYCFFTTDKNDNKIVLICKKINQ